MVGLVVQHAQHANTPRKGSPINNADIRMNSMFKVYEG